jgi:pimeloyl-ACP methyl ester carboxylesterase
MTDQPRFPELDGVTHRFVDLPGLRMHVAESGHGEPLLLLHGFPQHWWEWSKVLPALAQRYRVIAPDLRGAGWTDAPATGYNAEQLLADVVALLDALQLERVRLMAHDWGALVGFLLCLERPERVERYISLAIPHPYFKLSPRLLAAVPRLWFQNAIATPGLGPRLLSRGSQPMARYLLDHYTSDRSAFSPHDRELFVAPFRDPARARAGSALYRHFIVPLFVRVIAGRYRGMRLQTPTLIVYGRDDPNMSEAILDGYQRHADDLTLEEVSDASHFIADEKPQIVIDRALDFFAQGSEAG